MATTFGKELRKLRIDHDVRLIELAKKLAVSPALVSAVESGDRNPSTDFVEGAISAMKLSQEEATRIRKLASDQRTTVSVGLDNANAKSRELAFAFARRFDSLNAKDIEKLLNMLR